jgi:hypothetical protein
MVSTLFYFVDGGIGLAQSAIPFLKELNSRYDATKHVIFESDFEYEYVRQNIGDLPNTIFNNVVELVGSKSKNIDYYDVYFNFFKNNDESAYNNNDNETHDAIEYIRKLKWNLKSFIIENRINSICFCGLMSQVFKCVSVLLLHDISNERGISFYWVCATPIRGRFAIFDDIYFRSHLLKKKYSFYRDNYQEADLPMLRKYFKDYQNFKEDTHLPSLASFKKRKLKRAIFSRSGIIGIIVGMVEKVISPHRYNWILPMYNSSSDVGGNILLLLPKVDHWYCSYANRSLLSTERVVEKVRASIPDRFNLVVRLHPRMISTYRLRRDLKHLKNCFLDVDTPMQNLASGASVVVFYGTTAGVECLMEMKHVIELGERSLIFDFDDPPIKRITNFEELPSAINTLTMSTVPVEKIHSFFCALLECSFNFGKDISEITVDRTPYLAKAMAVEISKRLSADLALLNNQK